MVSTSSKEAAGVLNDVAERRAEVKRRFEEKMANIDARVTQLCND